MAKAATPKKEMAKPKNKQEQYERFQQAARDLGVDSEKNAELFERAFEKIIPPRGRPSGKNS
jgi:hypothetical protein